MTGVCHYYENSLSKVSAGAAYDDLNDEKVAPGSLLMVDHISVENATTAYTSLRIGVNHRGSIRFHEEEISPAAAELYWTDSKFNIPEGANLIIRCTGCTSGDILKVNIAGSLQVGSIDMGGRYAKNR